MWIFFSEGFDCPDVEFVQLARPTLSLAKYLQQVGRGLRKSDNKESCMLIDNVGLHRIFGLPVRDRDGRRCSKDGWREMLSPGHGWRTAGCLCLALYRKIANRMKDWKL